MLRGGTVETATRSKTRDPQEFLRRLPSYRKHLQNHCFCGKMLFQNDFCTDRGGIPRIHIPSPRSKCLGVGAADLEPRHERLLGAESKSLLKQAAPLPLGQFIRVSICNASPRRNGSPFHHEDVGFRYWIASESVVPGGVPWRFHQNILIVFNHCAYAA